MSYNGHRNQLKYVCYYLGWAAPSPLWRAGDLLISCIRSIWYLILMAGLWVVMLGRAATTNLTALEWLQTKNTKMILLRSGEELAEQASVALTAAAFSRRHAHRGSGWHGSFNPPSLSVHSHPGCLLAARYCWSDINWSLCIYHCLHYDIFNCDSKYKQLCITLSHEACKFIFFSIFI